MLNSTLPLITAIPVKLLTPCWAFDIASEVEYLSMCGTLGRTSLHVLCPNPVVSFLANELLEFLK